MTTRVTKGARLPSLNLKKMRDCSQSALKIVCYTAVFSVVTQRGGALRDDTENGCVADYFEDGSFLFHTNHSLRRCQAATGRLGDMSI